MTSLAAQIIDQQVSGIVERHADLLAGELRLGNDEQKMRSAAFVLLAARTAFDLTDREAFDGIVDGADDFGVDALYFGPPENGELPIVLMQGKYRSDLRGGAAFPENGIAKMIDAAGVLFDPERPVTLNRRLTQRVEEIRSFVRAGAIPRVTAVAANNGVRWTAQAQQRIDNAAANFGEQVSWRYLGSKELLALLQARKPIDAENIRRYPGLAGNRVNEAVAATLRSKDQRPNFYFYNNGVTIVCSKFRHNALQREHWSVQVDDLQIVNGGQTARTVQQIASEIGPDIETAEVLVRIYELERHDDALVEAITFATNSQNPVDLRDLRANDRRQQDLATSISGLGYRYRTKREDRAPAADEFTSAAVAEAVLAVWRRRPHQARFRGRDHFGALYDTIFTQDLNGAQAVVAALLLGTAEARRRNAPDDAPDFLAYGSRFIAMLLGRSLLEEMGVALAGLDHRNFARARQLIERHGGRYLAHAERQIDAALGSLFGGRAPTLQRLAAAFRRADLVDLLKPEAEERR